MTYFTVWGSCSSGRLLGLRSCPSVDQLDIDIVRFLTDPCLPHTRLTQPEIVASVKASRNTVSYRLKVPTNHGARR
jgi:hypothetical protein